MWDTLLFTCAICEREVRDYPDRTTGDRQVEPICRACESYWAARIGKPTAGAFMDRRQCIRIAALAEAIHSNAASISWRNQHG